MTSVELFYLDQYFAFPYILLKIFPAASSSFFPAQSRIFFFYIFSPPPSPSPLYKSKLPFTKAYDKLEEATKDTHNGNFN